MKISTNDACKALRDAATARGYGFKKNAATRARGIRHELLVIATTQGAKTLTLSLPDKDRKAPCTSCTVPLEEPASESLCLRVPGWRFRDLLNAYAHLNFTLGTDHGGTVLVVTCGTDRFRFVDQP